MAWEKRYPNDDGTLQERSSYELGVIHNMGYVDYFLIVWDFIHFAKIPRYHGRSRDEVPQREVSFPIVWRSPISIRCAMICSLSVS